eukprot:m.12115 g.12115  ORF g.12115 m.12115 type:complete len:290 (-) comp7962_c0_seq1:41-910(-)
MHLRRLSTLALNSHGVTTQGTHSSPLILLHGLLGNQINFRTVITRLKGCFEGVDPAKVPAQIFALDLRNHGKSEHSTDMSYEAMAGDVAAFLEKEGFSTANVLGHSMGGKVAMTLALTKPALVEKLIVADIAPVDYGPKVPTDSVLEALTKLPLDSEHSEKIRSVGQADKFFAHYLKDPGLRMFVLQNLLFKPLRWRIDLDSIIANRRTLSDFPFSSAGSAPPQTFSKPTLVVYGNQASYVQLPAHDADFKRLFPQVVYKEMKSGHWLHAEKPKQFSSIVAEFLVGGGG